MYQAYVILDSHELAAEPRYYRRDAIADADRMHAERDGNRRVVVIDENNKVVYDLPAA